MEIGKRINELRTIRNIKSGDLAKEVGISPTFLSYLENGTKNPSLDTLQKICNALDVTLGEFFSSENAKLPKDLQELIQNVKVLKPHQLKTLNEFLKSLMD